MPKLPRKPKLKRKPQPKTESQRQRWWINASIALYILSLVLPAVNYNSHDEFVLGIHVLVFGLIFGIFGLLFQAYTNILYIWAVLEARDGKTWLGLSVFAFLGGLTSFVLKKFPLMSDNMGGASINSWGWGAIFWISAYFILLLVLLWREYPAYKKYHIALLRCVPIFWVLVFFWGNYQYMQANDEERKRIFTPFTAFAVAPLSHIPYNPIYVHVEPDNIIEVEGEIDIPDEKMVFGEYHAPLPPKFVHQGKLYTQDYEWIVQTPQQSADFVLSYYTDDKHTGLRITEPKTLNILWQAPLIVRKIKSTDYMYPRYNFYELYKPLHDVTQFNFPKNTKQIIEKCALKQYETDLENYRKYNYQDTTFYFKQYADIKPDIMYCSDKNIFIFSNERDKICLYIFDRSKQVLSRCYWSKNSTHKEDKEKDQPKNQTQTQIQTQTIQYEQHLGVVFETTEKYEEVLLIDPNGNERIHRRN